MQLVSLISLPEDLPAVVKSLEAVELLLEEGKTDWTLRREAGHRDLYNFWSHGVTSNIEYVESIKEYTELPGADQKALFLTNYSMLNWLPYVYRCYKMRTEGIPLGDGTYLPVEEEGYSHLSAEWKTLYENVGRRLVSEVVNKMKKLALTKEEYLLLRAAALMRDYLSKESYATVKAVKSGLQSAILHTKPGSSEIYVSDVEGILQSLLAIGTLETNELVHLAPPVSQGEMFKPTAMCPN